MGFCAWNVVNVLLPVSGFGSARANHNAEFCIFGLNQKTSYHPTKVLNIAKNTYIYASHTKYLRHAPQTKYNSPVTSSVNYIDIYVSFNKVRAEACRSVGTISR